jgi:hypothetical protein
MKDLFLDALAGVILAMTVIGLLALIGWVFTFPEGRIVIGVCAGVYAIAWAVQRANNS